MIAMQSVFPPPLTRQQSAARRREDAILDAKFPGMHVAYLDHWNGDSLVREIIAFAEGAIEFQELVNALPREIMKRVQLTLIPEADVLSIPSWQIV